MNKEEILAASRKELKNQDMAEVECLKQGSRLAYMVGTVMGCLICGLQWIFTKSINWGCWVVNFSILGTVFLVKSLRLKRRHEIVWTIFLLAMLLFFFVGFVMSLRG